MADTEANCMGSSLEGERLEAARGLGGCLMAVLAKVEEGRWAVGEA